jgi:hypothetical protein
MTLATTCLFTIARRTLEVAFRQLNSLKGQVGFRNRRNLRRRHGIRSRRVDNEDIGRYFAGNDARPNGVKIWQPDRNSSWMASSGPTLNGGARFQNWGPGQSTN